MQSIGFRVFYVHLVQHRAPSDFDERKTNVFDFLAARVVLRHLHVCALRRHHRTKVVVLQERISSQESCQHQAFLERRRHRHCSELLEHLDECEANG